jgi:hypothetical protein
MHKLRGKGRLSSTLPTILQVQIEAIVSYTVCPHNLDCFKLSYLRQICNEMFESHFVSKKKLELRFVSDRPCVLQLQMYRNFAKKVNILEISLKLVHFLKTTLKNK